MVFELPYWALTTGLNVLITIVLAFRLLRMRRAVVETLGEVHAKLYTSVIAMIVESAVIYAAVGLICIITFAVGSNILNFVEPILGQILVRLCAFLHIQALQTNNVHCEVYLPRADNSTSHVRAGVDEKYD